MSTAQQGIFAVGTAAHCYLEFDRIDRVEAAMFVARVAGLEEPHTTVGGVNLVIAVRPELWEAMVPDHAPAAVRSFEQPVVGVDGFIMPATQHDAWVWVSGAAQDLVFDIAVQMIDDLRGAAMLATEATGWSYRHSRDLTGFEDGTENPPIAEAYEVAVVPNGEPGAGSSVLLFQQWVHLSEAWRALGVAEQERVIGRTKPDSVELDEARMPATSHVSRTVIEEGGEEVDIFRRNTPYGTVREHGTMFVGFSAEQSRLSRMLERMAGAEDGIRDALTRYSTPLSGAYYVVPSVQGLRAAAGGGPPADNARGPAS